MNQHSDAIRVLVTGAWRESEFAGLFDLPQCSVSFIAWPDVANVDPHDFDFAFVVQSRRNQFDENAIGKFAENWMLVSKAIITGTWCEGETRSGTPVAGLHRIRLADWSVESLRLIEEMRRFGTTWLNRPLTELAMDRELGQSDERRVPGPLKVGVHTVCRESRSTLSEFCRERNWTVVRWDSDDAFDIALVDCRFSIDECVEAIKQRGIDPANKPVVALLGFYRPSDQRQLVGELANLAAAEGNTVAVEVLPKPFDNELLETAINRLMQNGSLKVVHHVA